MQGRKRFTPQLFYHTSLENLVPKDNYYRILLRELDLHYLYACTSNYYGSEGQESIPIPMPRSRPNQANHAN
ncbi:hypothetical protein ABID46_001567 [Moheibacter stercoris]|uniref:Transposase n=1 Tax=Moheibacter stercoris TaxID=1628251 RepID=A0ABV2LTU8_9FLAO